MKKNWSIRMSKWMSMVFVLGMLLSYGSLQTVKAAGNTYYVSPTGSDSNPGTVTQPWQTLAKATSTLTAGDTAIFENGTYVQSATTTFTNSGTSALPITYKARNPRQAILKYNSLNTASKISLTKSYVVIQDFEITQDVRGTTSADKFIDIVNSSNSTITGNDIHNAYGNGIKVTRGANVTIQLNLVHDITGSQALITANSDSPVIKNNEINEVLMGIMTVGGTRSAQIFNNYIHTSTLTMNYGIVLGGNSPASAAFDPNGFEAYNSVAWNNKVISDVPGKIQDALSFNGSTDSAFYNNVVVGSQHGVKFMAGGGPSSGWAPIPTNPTYKNNIFEGNDVGARYFAIQPVNLVNDYNLYFSVVDVPVETNGIYGDPKWVNKYADWHLQTGSLAAQRGTAVTFTAYNGSSIDVSHDFDGTLRSAPWDMGIYESNLSLATIPPKPAPGGTYYVSPVGSDDNNGSQLSPWKTMAKAAESVQAGDTVLFADGTYNENRLAVFALGGTVNAPIVVKATNKRMAIINYQNMPTSKLVIKGKPYITLQDFEFTQNAKGTDTTDSIVKVFEGADHVTVMGNMLHNANEEGIKVNLVTDALIDGNYVYDMNHEGIDFVNVGASTIRNNEIFDVARNGIIVKGGSYDVQIYNNYIHNRNVSMPGSGIYIGGSTAAASTADSSTSGYENWNSVAFNNVILSETAGLMNQGITFMGSKNGAAYNNIVSGAKYNIYFQEPNDLANGWAWNPKNENPVFKNNIILNATSAALKIIHAPTNLVDDYNLYYNNPVGTAPTETHGIYGNPLIIDLLNNNWHLGSGSPAINAGTTISSFTFRNGSTTTNVTKDYDGVQRAAPWDMGIY